MEKPKRKAAKPPRYSSPPSLNLMEAEVALKAAEESVRQVEKTIWSSETRLLEKQDVLANVMTGYSGLLNNDESAVQRGSSTKAKERIFSASSATWELKDQQPGS